MSENFEEERKKQKNRAADRRFTPTVGRTNEMRSEVSGEEPKSTLTVEELKHFMDDQWDGGGQ